MCHTLAKSWVQEIKRDMDERIYGSKPLIQPTQLYISGQSSAGQAFVVRDRERDSALSGPVNGMGLGLKLVVAQLTAGYCHTPDKSWVGYYLF